MFASFSERGELLPSDYMFEPHLRLSNSLTPGWRSEEMSESVVPIVQPLFVSTASPMFADLIAPVGDHLCTDIFGHASKRSKLLGQNFTNVYLDYNDRDSAGHMTTRGSLRVYFKPEQPLSYVRLAPFPAYATAFVRAQLWCSSPSHVKLRVPITHAVKFYAFTTTDAATVPSLD